MSKPVAALATLVAAEEGVVDLDEPAGPPGVDRAAPARPRLGASVRRRACRSHRRAAAASTRTRASPSSARTSRRGPRCRSPSTSGRPSARRSGSASTPRATRAPACTRASRTSSRSAASFSRPALVAPETHEEMVAVQFPGLDGVLPDFGRFSPLDWGLGVELKGGEGAALVGLAHVAGRRSATSAAAARSSGSTRRAAIACAALTTRRFGDWAKEAWAPLSDAVVRELAETGERRERGEPSGSPEVHVQERVRLKPHPEHGVNPRRRAAAAARRTSPGRSSRRRTASSR